MPWTIDKRGAAVVVTMRSNPVNKMNPGFFDDLNGALDTIEREHPRLPLVLTAEGKAFSAGLDFEDVFPRFARGNAEEIGQWWERFRGSTLRLFSLPRRTVAAINGHAFAGGLILALCCDVRIAAEGDSQFSLNEVPIGIPMPAFDAEIIRYAVGSRAAAAAVLGGESYDAPRALALGFLHRVVPRGQLLDAALTEAARISPEAHAAYAASKQSLLHPTLRYIEGEALTLDRLVLRVVSSPDALRAHAGALDRLKNRPH